ncbi:hypothetical protein [Magnetospirillum aberrantis]|uniref:Uncharacterized protein n=1 Tax=Magnetospirillum aberrantis SpK TaxID=908842 RepID=A0A7C9UZ38_9PROT|nr:hypothetical protein [Magnetospirillum aberrantis]NFV80034.1 hypothetical protein [Magnetospirillum aberrantis SpK]
MSLHPRQFWQVAFDAAKASGKCDFDAARMADKALTEAADWEVVKLTAPLPIPVRRTCRRASVGPDCYPGA